MLSTTDTQCRSDGGWGLAITTRVPEATTSSFELTDNGGCQATDLITEEWEAVWVRRSVAASVTLGWFVLVPCVFGVVVPWSLTGWQARQPTPYWAPVRVVGVVLVVIGAVVLVQAFARFVTEGAGTPVPVAPTERLVVGGLYRYVRNPIYLAGLAVIVGQGLLLGQAALFVYAAGVAFGFVVLVHGYEEPALKRRYGEEYEAYCQAVPAWWPRIPSRLKKMP